MPTFGPASIAAGADDYWHRPADNDFRATETSVIAGYADGGIHAVFWFDGVTIDQGTTIDSMVVDLVSAGETGTAFTTNWYAVDEDDPAKATTDATCDTDDAARTTAFVAHDDNNKAAGTAFSSPDIATVGQELVDRAGWVSGNAMLIQWVADGGSNYHFQEAASYENTSYAQATLTITYTEPTINIVTLSPADDATNINPAIGQLDIEFDDVPVKDAGYVKVVNADLGALHEVVAIGSCTVVGNTLEVPIGALPPGTNLYVQIEAGALSNFPDGILDTTTWNFRSEQHGAASGSIGLSGTVAGVVETPAVTGAAAGETGLSGTAAGEVDHFAAVAGATGLEGTVAAVVDTSSAAAGETSIEGTVDGLAVVPGAAAGEIAITAGPAAGETEQGTWIAIWVGGVRRSVQYSRFRYQDRLLRRSTCSFTINDFDGTLDLEGGEQVEIRDLYDRVVLRGHILDAPTMRPLHPPSGSAKAREWDVDVVDKHYRADKRLAAISYPDPMQAGLMVADLTANFLNGEGIVAVPGTGQTLRIPPDGSVSTPEHASLNPTDLDVRAIYVGFRRRPVPAQMVLGKWGEDGAKQFRFLVDSGTLTLEWSEDGTAVKTSAASEPLTPGHTHLRVTLDVDDGAGQHVVTFYAGTDYTTVLGEIRTYAGTTSVFSGGEDLVGSMPEYCNSLTLLDGIDGTPVANPVFTDPVEWPDDTPHSDSAGREWTLYDGAAVTAATVMLGPVIPKAKFGYVPVADAFEAISERASAWWRIDNDGVLHMQPRSAYAAPWALTGAYVNDWTKLKVTPGNRRYRNRQYLRGGWALTDPQTQEFHGDDKTQTFPVGFPIMQVPTVEVDRGAGFVEETVGIRGLATGKDWYWAGEEHEISQDLYETTPLSPTDVLRVTYVGRYPLLIVLEDLGEILNRAAREGTSGKVESSIVEPGFLDPATGYQQAGALLARYGHGGRILRFRTLREGLLPGHLLTVTLPTLGFTASPLLVQEVEWQAPGARLLVYDVEAVEGPPTGGWVDWFTEQQAAVDKSQGIFEGLGETETLGLVEDISEAWSWGETMDYSVVTCSRVGIDAVVGTSVVC